MVIGGGVAGIAAATALADDGIQVYLIEREPFIGGWAASFCCKSTDVCTKCSVCLVAQQLKEVSAHPRISILTHSTVTGITGSVGDFGVEVRQERPCIDPGRCVACGICADVCPAQPNAIRPPSPEALPYTYVLDDALCLRFKGEECAVCRDKCPTQAITFDREPKKEEFSVAAVIVATGFDVFDAKQVGGLGYGRYPGVLTGLDVERIFNREGCLTLSTNGESPHSVAFVQCVGSRSEQHGYCSQVCCKYAMRFALLIQHQDPSAEVTIFYMDLQHAGKGFAEFYEQCQEKIRFIRGIPVEVLQAPTGQLEVRFENISKSKVERKLFDAVVLSVGLVPRTDCWDVAAHLGVNLNPYGFFDTLSGYSSNETHVEGIFVAGACQGPRDIPDSMAHGIAAAEKAMEVLKRCERTRLSFSAIAGEA